MGRKITENLGFESPLQTVKKIAVFYGEFENEQKSVKKILTCRSGDSNSRFSVIFPFKEGEGDKFKSKQASKRDRTLLT